jgi:DNA repair protein RadA/Sms
MEGRRPLFFEIQTLAAPSMLAMPRRVVKGVDYNKVLLLLAVIRKNIGLPLDKYDIYVNVIGGVDIKSTAADLGIIASLLSSLQNIPLSNQSLFIGEVGLLGEVRKVFGEDRITNEAKRLKFNTIFSPSNIKTIKELKRILKT